jgi:hypothetical protein
VLPDTGNKKKEAFMKKILQFFDYCKDIFSCRIMHSSFLYKWSCSCLLITLLAACSLSNSDLDAGFLHNIYPQSWNKKQGIKLMLKLQNLEEKNKTTAEFDKNRTINSLRLDDNLNDNIWLLNFQQANTGIAREQTEAIRLSQNAQFYSCFMKNQNYSQLIIRHIESGEQIEFEDQSFPESDDKILFSMNKTEWAPCGNFLAYTNWKSSNSGLFLILINYDKFRNFFEFSYYSLEQNNNITYALPNWSPDGRYIACTRFKKDDSSDILIYDLLKNEKTILNDYNNIHSFLFSSNDNDKATTCLQVAPGLFKMALIENIFKTPKYRINDHIVSDNGFCRSAVSPNGSRIATVYNDIYKGLMLKIYFFKDFQLQKDVLINARPAFSSNHFPVSPPIWLWNDNFLTFADYNDVYYFFVNEKFLDSNSINRKKIASSSGFYNVNSLNYCPGNNQIVFTAHTPLGKNSEIRGYFFDNSIIKQPVIPIVEKVLYRTEIIEIKGDIVSLKAIGRPIVNKNPNEKISACAIIIEKKPVLYLNHHHSNTVSPGNSILCEWDTRIQNPNSIKNMKFEFVQLSEESDTKINN